jgi:hypothetical protein
MGFFLEQFHLIYPSEFGPIWMYHGGRLLKAVVQMKQNIFDFHWPLQIKSSAS